MGTQPNGEFMKTRKHFRATAAEVAKIADKTERQEAAFATGKVFADDNPLFKWSLYLFACGVK